MKIYLFPIAMGLAAVTIFVLIFNYIEPAPPKHFIIATDSGQSDLEFYAKEYEEILKEDGITLEIRSTNGSVENLNLLQDPYSGVEAAFVPDGLGSAEKQPDVSSLGSLYYEPIWIFYRGNKEISHFSQFAGKRIGVGKVGNGNQILAQRLLELNGVSSSSVKILNLNYQQTIAALEKGEVDAGFFLLPPTDPIIRKLSQNKNLHLMNIEQAEAISRKDGVFHHLVLPRGAIDLNADIPKKDINLVASTAMLLISDSLHPALTFLLLKAASQIHDEPGIFEKRGEFPTIKDAAFPVSNDAVQFYKTGGSFWQRYLPFWLAVWFDRFLLLMIPIIALLIPLIRTVPMIYNWRMRAKVYQRYGELKFLETKIHSDNTPEHVKNFLRQLDIIEDRVDAMKMPKTYADFIYSLKGHIQLVRDRLKSTL